MRTIEARQLGKRYRRTAGDRPHTLQEAFLTGFRGLGESDYVWSLREVTFTLESGRVLGVIGRNGAGKSTLLRITGGVSPPDEGVIRINGRVGGLLELTAGFHPDLTGRENAEIGGVLRGLSRREVLRKFDSVVEFAELERAIDRPLRTYSTGMQMRLAFSVAIHARPEILLVDEVLAVGDLAFQEKCLERIRSLRDEGCSILLVSHDASLVQKMCTEALWLKEGRVAAFGSAVDVLREYISEMRTETLKRAPSDVGPSDGQMLELGLISVCELAGSIVR